jgi:hypothetical protein
MRISISVILFFIFTVTFSKERPDSLKPKLNAGVTFSLNSNGIASIPAFSLGKPAMMASTYFIKGRFSYEPLLAYGLDGKPWFIDNWFHYKPIVRTKYELRVGFNLSTFGSEYELPEGAIIKAERYFAFELTQTYKFNSQNFLSLAYWNDRGQEPGSISGHFLSLTGERSDIRIGKNVLLAANVMLFYINYTGNSDGLFVSPKVSAYVRSVPVTLFFQATQTIQTNIEPYPEFRWNVGISYTL